MNHEIGIAEIVFLFTLGVTFGAAVLARRHSLHRADDGLAGRNLRIALSKVALDSSGGWRYPDHFGLLDEQMHVVVPIGMLSMLTIGSIWQDGKLVANPQYSQETFTVTGHHAIAPLVKAGTENNDGYFILPFEAHPYPITPLHLNGQ